MTWRPIETAPKDGTPILACVGSYSHQYNLWPSLCPQTIYWGTYHPNSAGQKCWRDGSGHKRPGMTHWMPLPKPPEDGDGT